MDGFSEAKAKDHRVDDRYKIVIVGNTAVGKTRLLTSFTTDNPDSSTEGLPTIGIDFKLRTVETDGKQIRLQLWDTAGSEQFQTMTTAFYRGAQGLIVVYDMTNPDSFERVAGWIKLFQENSPTGACKTKWFGSTEIGIGIPVMLIANKLDCEADRKVSRSRGKQFAKKNGMKFMETSAKTGQNVDEAFLTLAADIKKHRDKSANNQSGGISKRDQKKFKARLQSFFASKVFSWFSRASW